MHPPEHDVDEGAPLNGAQVHDEPVGGVQPRDGQPNEHQEREHDEKRHADGHAAHNGQATIVEVGEQDGDCEEAAWARPPLQQPCARGRLCQGFLVWHYVDMPERCILP